MDASPQQEGELFGRCAEFFNENLGTLDLDAMSTHVARELSPQDVFPKKELLEWAADQKPDDIFSYDELRAWSEANGFVRE